MQWFMAAWSMLPSPEHLLEMGVQGLTAIATVVVFLVDIFLRLPRWTKGVLIATALAAWLTWATGNSLADGINAGLMTACVYAVTAFFFGNGLFAGWTLDGLALGHHCLRKKFMSPARREDFERAEGAIEAVYRRELKALYESYRLPYKRCVKPWS